MNSQQLTVRYFRLAKPIFTYPKMYIFTREMKQAYHKTLNENNHIYVWKLTSTWSDFIVNPLLSQEELQALEKIKSGKRKTEFLATRIALKELFSNTLELKHHESGRPYIKEIKHISISHSKNYIAIAFGDENIGIDIEKPQEKMLKLIPRILSEKECEEFQKNPSTESACKLWGSKESILKCIGDKNINYRDDIKIETNELSKAKYLDQDFDVYYEKIDGMILTYVIKV